MPVGSSVIQSANSLNVSRALGAPLIKSSICVFTNAVVATVVSRAVFIGVGQTGDFLNVLTPSIS